MVKFTTVGKAYEKISLVSIKDKITSVMDTIENKSGAGNDFLGWLDYTSKLDKAVVKDLVETAKYLRSEVDVLVVIGIGGSYLGARAAIDAINGLYSKDKMEIIYLGNTLSSNYTYQVLDYLKDKKFAINVISKSGTTTEPAIAFRLCKELLIEKVGKEKANKLIIATTDKARGALKTEADAENYHSFIIPDDVGGRYSVITPVGLLPMAVAGIDIEEFIDGIIEGEKEYSVKDIEKNPAYRYGATRYLLNQLGYPSEMFISYEPQMAMINEWLKQLFGESEGKEGKALLPTSCTFTTDLHSMGQFIQQGSPVIFETIIKPQTVKYDLTIKEEKTDLDGLNYLAGKKLSYVNDQAYLGTLKAHTEGQVSANILEIEALDAKNLGNLFYFFMRSCAMSAYLLDINPFDQPGVEIYKKNMFTLLGKPSKK